MIEVLLWILMSVITQIVKKTEIDARIIILVLSIIAGVAFYFVKEAYPDFVDKVYEKVLWSYAISQVIYNYIISIRLEKKPTLSDNKKQDGEKKKS